MELTENNPLMQPVQYQGRTYFTSHYFHQEYQVNSDGDGKYDELKSFNRLIRSLEAYENYIDRGDIVELSKEKAGTDLVPAFKATFGNPIMLINATAQIALTHHLDDEISKQISVAANEKTANQKSLPSVTDPTLAALVQSLVEIDRVKQKQFALEQKTVEAEQKADEAQQKTELLENRVQNVELQHRNGVPEGYLSKKQAHHLHGIGLSSEIFHLAMAATDVQTKSYIHRGEDAYEVATFAYREDEVSDAVELFLDDAKQSTPKTCESPMLNGKRFRYVKEGAQA